MNRQRRITPATYITISRFFLVPIFIHLFLTKRYLPAIIVLGIAAFTDVLDGFIARRFNMLSRLGSLLDPLADKFLMVVSFVVMSHLKIISWKLTFLIIGKDLWMLVGVAILKSMKIHLYYKPTIISKLTTLSQITLLALSFGQVYLNSLPNKGPWISPSGESPSGGSPFFKLRDLFLLIAGIMTVMTFIQYTYIGYRFYRYGERKKEKISRLNQTSSHHEKKNPIHSIDH